MWIDYPYLSERLDHDHELIQDLLGVFMDEYTCLLAELNQAVQTGQSPKRPAHGIKGMCRDVGATELAAWAASLENGDGEVNALTQKLNDALPSLQAEISQRLSETTAT